MTRLGAVVLGVLGLLVGCKGKDPEKKPPEAIPHPMPEPVPVPTPGEWATCKAALEASPKTPETRRVAALITACKPCGDWTPLLNWATATEDGGPKRKDIENAMVGCKAYCDPNAKQRFLGILDDNRGKERITRLPWRSLGEFCKENVSAVPDSRFMSAPYFALDRIARDVAARPDGAPLLAAIDLQLPPASLTGAGPVLPESSVTSPTSATTHVTITADEIHVGVLPRAKLSDKGVSVSAGEPYPGLVVKLADLPAALDKAAQPALVMMPKKMPGARLAEVLATTKRRPLQLALAATSGLPGWDIYGVSPVAIVGEVDPKELAQDKSGRMVFTVAPDKVDAIVAEVSKATALQLSVPPSLVLAPEATVETVAQVLGALAYKDFKTAVITVAPPTKKAKP